MDIGGGPLMVDQSNWINESLPGKHHQQNWIFVKKEQLVSV